MFLNLPRNFNADVKSQSVRMLISYLHESINPTRLFIESLHNPVSHPPDQSTVPLIDTASAGSRPWRLKFARSRSSGPFRAPYSPLRI